LEVSKELPQRLTLNTFFVALSFLIVCLHSLTLFALAFLVSATFSSVRPIFCPTVDTIFCSSWDNSPANLWILPTFSEPQNMNPDDLTAPVAAAATSQVKLCPYDEEEPHIWFRLIEAQFAAAGIKSQKT
jgi:hypothetical protein